MTPEQREAVIIACEAFGERIEIFLPGERPSIFEKITAGVRNYVIAWYTAPEGGGGVYMLHSAYIASDWPTHEEIRT
jgi:hypothetical protein